MSHDLLQPIKSEQLFEIDSPMEWGRPVYCSETRNQFIGIWGPHVSEKIFFELIQN